MSTTLAKIKRLYSTTEAALSPAAKQWGYAVDTKRIMVVEADGTTKRYYNDSTAFADQTGSYGTALIGSEGIASIIPDGGTIGAAATLKAMLKGLGAQVNFVNLTTNIIPRKNSSNVLVDSAITDNGTTVSISRAVTMALTLALTGDLSINTNKFTVTAASGNTLVAGTLSATGDFAVNTNKFTVAASSGNTVVAGTLGVTGLTTAAAITASGVIQGNSTGGGAAASFYASAVQPVFMWNVTGAASNTKNWDISGGAATLTFRTRGDAYETGISWLTVTRTAIASVDTIAFIGTAASFSGTLTSTGKIIASAGCGIAGVLSVGTTINDTYVAQYILNTGLTGNTTMYGLYCNPTFGTGATTAGNTAYFKLQTAVASFTMTTGVGVNIVAPVIGAGSTVTTLYGLKISDQSGGGTNYSIYTGAGAVRLGDTLTVVGAFGCNAATAQTAYASGGALAAYGAGANGFDSGANASALHALVVKIRAALVANGIMS